MREKGRNKERREANKLFAFVVIVVVVVVIFFVLFKTNFRLFPFSEILFQINFEGEREERIAKRESLRWNAPTQRSNCLFVYNKRSFVTKS